MSNPFRGGNWMPHVPSFFGGVPALYSREPLVMRRKSPNGDWNYRLPTEEEKLEWFEARQY